MRGELFIISNIVSKHERNVLKPVGDTTVEKMTHVILDEYWKEFRRKIDKSPHNIILARGLGKWENTYSPLKGYIRDSVRRLRKLRKRLKRLEGTKDYQKNNSMTYALERDLTSKIQASWKQLDSLRKVHIKKMISFNKWLRENNRAHDVRVDYEKIDFKFLNSNNNSN